MAEPGLSQIVSITQRYRQDKLYDNVRNNHPLLANIKKKLKSGGSTLVSPLTYQQSPGGWYNGGDLLDVTIIPNITAAEYNWYQAYASMVITGREFRQNQGEEAVLDLIESKLDATEATIENIVDAGLASAGTATNEMPGLRAFVAKTPTNTVGGINRNTAGGAFFKNYEFDTVNDGGAAFSASNVKQYLTKAKIATKRGRMGEMLGFAGDSVYEYAQVAAMAGQRYNDVPKKEALANMGFENVLLAGVPIVQGGGVNFGGQTQIGDTDFYLLDLGAFEWCVHRQADFKMLPVRFSINQDADVRLVIFMGALTSGLLATSAVLYDAA